MADNFLERQQEEFQRLKSSGGEARRRRWLKQLKACLRWFSTQFHSLRNSISHAWSASCLTLGVSYPAVFGPMVTVAGAPDSDLPTKSTVISFPLLRPLRPVGFKYPFL